VGVNVSLKNSRSSNSIHPSFALWRSLICSRSIIADSSKLYNERDMGIKEHHRRPYGDQADGEPDAKSRVK
jgi:hypothetical protein